MPSIALAGPNVAKTRKSIPIRAWATPLTIGSFLLMATTGVLMFFGVRGGLISEAHEWFSWAFLAGAVAHLVVNVRPLTLHLKSRWGRISIAAAVVVLVVAVFPSGVRTGHQVRHAVEQAVVDAPLSTLATLANVSPTDLENRLKAHGVTATLNQSLHDLSDQNGMDEHALLGIVFMKD